MDPITTAIIGALAVGVAAASTQVVVDAYDALKKTLREKFGDESDLVDAVHRLEHKPDSWARAELLQEEVEAVKAVQEPVIRDAAQRLLNVINAQSVRSYAIQNIQSVYGDYSAVAGASGTATVNINYLKSTK
jgi:hypothetical protein